MNRMTRAGAALLGAAAIAVPVLAWSADRDPGEAAGFDQGGAAGDAAGHHDRGAWMHRAMMRSPDQACTERLARRAGVIAYVGAKLNLTAAQKPLWDQLQETLQTSHDKLQQACAALKPAGDGHPLTVLDRLQQRERLLSAQLQALQQAEPQVQALYQALTPEQKAIVDHPFRHRG